MVDLNLNFYFVLIENIIFVFASYTWFFVCFLFNLVFNNSVSVFTYVEL